MVGCGETGQSVADATHGSADDVSEQLAAACQIEGNRGGSHKAPAVHHFKTAEAVSYPPFGDARHRRVPSDTSKRGGRVSGCQLTHGEPGQTSTGAEPRPSGYRGMHLIYSYRANRKHALDGLNVEIQIRTSLQHQWATAVETVGTFTGEALKSGGGEEDWLRFFVLRSSRIAHVEGLPTVQGTPEDPDSLRRELREVAGRVRAEESLESFQSATAQLQRLKAPKGGWFVLELDHQRRRTTGSSFGSRDANEASDFSWNEKWCTVNAQTWMSCRCPLSRWPHSAGRSRTTLRACPNSAG